MKSKKIKYTKGGNKLRANRIICLAQKSGFFSNFNNITSCLMSKKEHDLVEVDFSGNLKGFRYSGRRRDLNIWNLFFEPIKTKKQKNIKYTKKIYGQDIPRTIMDKNIYERRSAFQLNFGQYFYEKIWMEQEIWRSKANYFVNKYIKLKPYLKEKINTFYENNFNPNNTIAVHIRHPGIYVEQPRFTLPTCQEYIYHIKNNYDYKNATIFLATDYKQPINLLKKEFKNLVIQDASRTRQDRRQIHMIKGGKPSLAEEAITDVYLMSKCNYMVHVISNLPLAAVCINKNVQSDLICII